MKAAGRPGGRSQQAVGRAAPTNPKIITVPMHTGDLKTGVLNKLLRIAGLK